jgi:hypothetical protein
MAGAYTVSHQQDQADQQLRTVASSWWQHPPSSLFWECLLHMSTFATTRVALPTGVKPG